MTRTPPAPATARLPPVLAAALLAAALLAGCATGDGPASRIVVDFPDPHADHDAKVPAEGVANAYDQLLAWSRAAGVRVDVREFGAGHCLDAIDGVPPTPGCSAGAAGYWMLSVNGEASMVGMDATPVRAGDTVTWTYTPSTPAGGSTSTPTSPAPSGTATGSSPAAAQGQPPSGPPQLRIDPPAPTQDATLTLTGTIDRPVRLTATNATPQDVPAGPWTVAVPLDYGRTTVRVLADDGKATTALDVQAVRLAKATFEAKFTAHPIHDDLRDDVWLDLDAHPSAPLYDGTTATHPPHATIHDLLVAWTQMTGKPIEYGGPGSFGFSVESIDGVGQPLTSAAPPYWCYKLNGSGDVLGISGQELKPDDVVVWEYAACG